MVAVGGDDGVVRIYMPDYSASDMDVKPYAVMSTSNANAEEKIEISEKSLFFIWGVSQNSLKIMEFTNGILMIHQQLSSSLGNQCVVTDFDLSLDENFISIIWGGCLSIEIYEFNPVSGFFEALSQVNTTQECTSLSTDYEAQHIVATCKSNVIFRFDKKATPGVINNTIPNGSLNENDGRSRSAKESHW